MSESGYDRLPIHRAMLLDTVRTSVFQRAIAATVRPHHVVLDVGAGTGILSIFAAQAGARKVYAVERTDVARFARGLVARNGLSSRVEVIQRDIEAAVLPARVDLIVSEWLGAYGVDENLLPVVLLARDRWLRPGGRMLPERVTAWMAPVREDGLDAELSFWRGRPYGADLTPIAEATVHEASESRRALTAYDLAADPRPLWTHDVYTCPAETARRPFRASVAFRASHRGPISALAAWFTADFGRGLTLTNAPGTAPTHWGRCIFPLRRATIVKPGTPIHVEFICRPAGSFSSRAGWAVRIGSGGWDYHGGFPLEHRLQ
jgi:SAM-dependent methyltransferase